MVGGGRPPEYGWDHSKIVRRGRHRAELRGDLKMSHNDYSLVRVFTPVSLTAYILWCNLRGSPRCIVSREPDFVVHARSSSGYLSHSCVLTNFPPSALVRERRSIRSISVFPVLFQCNTSFLSSPSLYRLVIQSALFAHRCYLVDGMTAFSK